MRSEAWRAGWPMSLLLLCAGCSCAIEPEDGTQACESAEGLCADGYRCHTGVDFTQRCYRVGADYSASEGDWCVREENEPRGKAPPRGQSLAESLSTAEQYSASEADKVEVFKRAHYSSLGIGIAAASTALALFIYAAKRNHTSSERAGSIYAAR